MKKIQLYLNYAGFCEAQENQALRDGRKRKIQFFALFGLIRHPEKGYILFDTGYSERFYEATQKYPARIYAKITKVSISPEEEVHYQLKQNGISPEEIRIIVLSHFHADHTGGLKDFPNAEIYCSKKAFEQVTEISSVLSFSKGILKSQHPADLGRKVKIIEDKAVKVRDEVFGEKYDLFGDESVFVFSLPGHAAGQTGIMVETEKQKYFLIADACWLKRSYQEMVLPTPLVKLFFHSWSDFKASLKKVNEYYLKNPDTVIVPTHCEETTRSLVNNKIDWNVL